MRASRDAGVRYVNIFASAGILVAVFLNRLHIHAQRFYAFFERLLLKLAD